MNEQIAGPRGSLPGEALRPEGVVPGEELPVDSQSPCDSNPLVRSKTYETIVEGRYQFWIGNHSRVALPRDTQGGTHVPHAPKVRS